MSQDDNGSGAAEQSGGHTASQARSRVDIPSNPDNTYEKDGWFGMGDWLGTGRIALHLRQYRSFDDARAFVHGLGLTSQAKWMAYCKSGKKPDDIPAAPRQTYLNDGWAGYGDWLGYAR